jgi:hypothetical protein
VYLLLQLRELNLNLNFHKSTSFGIIKFHEKLLLLSTIIFFEEIGFQEGHTNSNFAFLIFVATYQVDLNSLNNHLKYTVSHGL